MNYLQIPINVPIVPIANFQWDGFMIITYQGTCPNYQSSIQPLTYKKKPYEDVKHEAFLGHAQADLSEMTERKSNRRVFTFDKWTDLVL